MQKKSMETGKIGVQTENIFPIIKKFLYSEQEIFLRELVSNAVDATQKLKTLSSTGKFKEETGDLFVEVILKPEENEIIIRDKGIGMTADEVKKYINQIAFSSAKEFVEKFKENGQNQLIGNFGLGFYSAFMVAEKVILRTKSYQKNTKGVEWECEGSTSFTMKKVDDIEERGTEVVLKLAEDAKEFTDKHQVRQLLERFCRFLPVPIKLEGEQINDTEPIWVKQPSELKDEDYLEFYKKLYPFSEPPLFWIHLNVDFPFNLTGVLYFPKLKKDIEFQKNKIQLYCRQVFVTDHVEGVVPEFLMYLHGVIDSPDIPLNVSRSYLQGDPNVKKINSHINKKVADKLKSLFQEDRKTFENKWNDIGFFIKYGVLSEPKFDERARDICLLKNLDNKYHTLEEYKQFAETNQKDKNGKTIFIYADNPEEQHNYIQSVKAYNYDILEVDKAIDHHFMSHVEQKLDQVSFVRVDADTPDKIIEKEDAQSSVLDKEEEEKLQKLFTDKLENKELQISIRALGMEEEPVKLIKPEMERRMRDVSHLSGTADFLKNMPEKLNLVINGNHPVMSKILVQPSEEKQKEQIQHLYDMALLSQNMLKGEKLTRFLKRSVEML